MVLPLLSTDITMEISGITTVLPLDSTNLPVVITPNFTTGFHWYTTGLPLPSNSRDIFYEVIILPFSFEIQGQLMFGSLTDNSF